MGKLMSGYMDNFMCKIDGYKDELWIGEWTEGKEDEWKRET